MFKKVNAREKVVGWYSTGPKIRPTDLEINEKIRRYTPNPVMVIIDVNPQDDNEIPTTAYVAVENAPEAQSKSRMTFQHLTCEIGALEAEEVGVEHLLRNIRDNSQGTVTDRVNAKLTSLKALKKRIEDMHMYLSEVIKGTMPVNTEIVYNIQSMLNLCHDFKVKELAQAFAVKSNDAQLTIYVSQLIRSILALDRLINNKLENRELEAKLQGDKAKAEEAKHLEAERAKEKEKENKEKDKPKDGDKEKGKDGDKMETAPDKPGKPQDNAKRS